jgi:hypothetical protein
MSGQYHGWYVSDCLRPFKPTWRSRAGARSTVRLGQQDADAILKLIAHQSYAWWLQHHWQKAMQ